MPYVNKINMLSRKKFDETRAAEKRKRKGIIMLQFCVRSLTLFVIFFLVLFIITALHITITTTTVKEASRSTDPYHAIKAIDPRCNLFSGKWVYDNSSNNHPPYKDQKCTFMDDGVACEKYGRKNLTYLYWRWQPHDCDLPRFDAYEILEKLRNKRVVYVGDSVNRNQWVSMVCLIESSIPDQLKYVQYNGSLITFKALEYNVSVDFYWEPLLVESNGDDPWCHRVAERIISAKAIEKHARHWSNADILVFNSYIWWGQPNLKLLLESVETNIFDHDQVHHQDIEKLSAYEMALKTWSDWLHNHVDPTRTRLFFVSLSPTHLRSEGWGKAKDQKCMNETEPILKEGYSGMDSDSRMTRLVEAAMDGLRSKGFKAQILNITQLSEYRKDAHPAMNRKFWDPIKDEEFMSRPNSLADCIHWCLPGVPDVWNQLLYAYLLYF